MRHYLLPSPKNVVRQPLQMKCLVFFVLVVIGIACCFPVSVRAVDFELGDIEDIEETWRNCGSEIEWRDSWSDAKQEAMDTGRPIFAFASDKYDVPSKYWDILTRRVNGHDFMHPGVIDALNRKYIPFKHDGEKEFLKKKLGVSVENPPTMVVVSPKGETLEPSFYRATWRYPEMTYYTLRDILKENPKYDVPSEETKTLLKKSNRTPQDQLQLGISLIRDARMEKAIDPLRDALQNAKRREVKVKAQYRLGVAYHRLRKPEPTQKALRKALELDPENQSGIHIDVRIEQARLYIHQGKFKKAETLMKNVLKKYPDHPHAKEARYLLGIAHFHQYEQKDKAVKHWEKLIRKYPDNRWGWTAAYSLSAYRHRHPFRYVRWREGVLQRDISVTEQPVSEQNLKEAIRRGCEYLINNVTEEGWWTARPGENPVQMERYHSITPIVYMALDAWKNVLPEKNKSVRKKALQALDQWDLDTMDFAGGKDWALLFNLEMETYLLSKDGQNIDREYRLKRTNRIIRSLEESQDQKGRWRYPFATAAVLVALHQAKELGGDVPEGMVKKGFQPVLKSKTKGGYFSYELNSKERHSAPESSAGRLCVGYLAEYLWGKNEQQKLAWAFSEFMKYKNQLAKVRKSLMQHQGEYGVAPYYFFFGHYYAAKVLEYLPESKRRKAARALQKDILKIREKDGTWIDDYQNGKNYGTAMALLILRKCREALRN